MPIGLRSRERNPGMRKIRPNSSNAKDDPLVVPVVLGAPTWVTPELLADTLGTWKHFYSGELTQEQAFVILLTVGQLFDALREGNEQAVCSPGTSFEPRTGT